jgi:hypothetical protein
MNRPFPIIQERVEKSPFKNTTTLKSVLMRYKAGETIGFTYTSSLKSMGLIPRSSGVYQLGEKYATVG